MENQTGFDLNTAIKNWRQEINGQSQLTAENCRELDAHLTDTIRELQKRGLNDEESFWLARRRVGNMQQVAEEFAKADPARLRRERVFWMACAILALSIWHRWTGPLIFGSPISSPVDRRLRDWLPDWVIFYLPHWMQEIRKIDLISIFSILISLAPFVAAIFLIKKNYWQRTETVIDFLFKSRGRFVAASALLCFVPILIWVATGTLHNHGLSILQLLVEMLVWDGPCIALIAWLMPVRNGRKRAA